MLSGMLCMGNDVYERDCMKCHAVNGNGDTKMGQRLAVRNWSDAKVQSEMTDVSISKVIKEGVKDSEGRTRMKAYPDMTELEIKNMIKFIRSLKK